MAKKTAGQKAAATRKAKIPTLRDIDLKLALAAKRLNAKPPQIIEAKMAITNARTKLRKACELPPLK